MLRTDRRSLWDAIRSAGDSGQGFLWGADGAVRLADLERGSSLGLAGGNLRGKSVLVATSSQFAAALALIELDGVARRLVLCPPDLALEYLPVVMAQAAVHVVVSDRTDLRPELLAGAPVIPVSATLTPAEPDRTAERQTEFVLFTSGTSGVPKMVVHTLPTLAASIGYGETAPVWGTFYDIRRYGGLQVFLRAMLGGGSLVVADAGESTADFLERAGAHGVTHMTGTPSHWRRALMTPASRRIAPRSVRLSGEIADQSILDHIRSAWPGAKIAHAFASTEAGVAFEVNDGIAGFPANLIGAPGPVEMRIGNGSLRVRSPRTALRYLGHGAEPLKDAEGFVDTHDMLELRGGRYWFAGRRDGVINVGGMKVHPEEVEAVINRHPDVRMSLVRTRKNSITGALVVADVVLKNAEEPRAELERDILRHCHRTLPRHKVPTLIRIVGSLAVSPAGKLVRRYA